MEENQILKDILKKEGLRYTHQRQLIWDELCSSKSHRDAEDIYFSLRRNEVTVSRATVYRTIDVLVKNDLVRKLELGEGRARYERKDQGEHHDHIICIECGKIEEFMDNRIELLQDKIFEKFTYKSVRHIHQLFGICKACQ